MFTFQNILILLLFIALVAKELLPMVLAKFGIIKNGPTKTEKMLELISNHQHTEAKEEIDKINETLKRIEDNLTRNFGIIHENMAKERETLAGIRAKLNGYS